MVSTERIDLQHEGGGDMAGDTLRLRRSDDAVRAATASVRGAALAIAVSVGAIRERIAPTVATDETVATDDRASVHTYAGLVRDRSRLRAADERLRSLEQHPMQYARRMPADAPVSGGDLPQVQVARQLLDDARDTLLELLRTVREEVAMPVEPSGTTTD